MKRLPLLACCLLISFFAKAATIIVKNIAELNAANKNAQPGDIIILQNGEWNNVAIKLNCNGTKELPVTFKAAVAGKVLITGHSQLKLGGNFIVVDGLSFTNGYAGDDAIIDFRIDSKQLANNCRVTNTVIDDFNNPKRMDENYWISFSGKNNRLDHCSFKGKKNMGVLLAVILDDDRSRENFHSIDHNYFGRRQPLASNSGEIIRVGVSQHCEFNSNTQITDNFFEHCDGETEIISIKSCSNVVRGNLFKESQGGVVLRHGNYNTVEDNVFLGNNKEGTGGVRIINKGQWVVNNFFYQCRGTGFRSPLSLMNGIPNSPAFRYVQVTDAVIANNTFYNCAPASFCEGSDTERTLPPANVKLLNNVFYNTTDKIIYNVYDDIGGFHFAGNEISNGINQSATAGFKKTAFSYQKNNTVTVPVSLTNTAANIPDSLESIAQSRLHHLLAGKPGFSGLQLIKKIQDNAYNNTGARWFVQQKQSATSVTADCKNAKEIYDQLASAQPVNIRLTATSYSLDKPFIINKTVQFIGNTNEISFSTGRILAAFLIAGNGNLILKNIKTDGEKIQAAYFIASDSSGSSNHYNLSINNCMIKNLDKKNGCSAVFFAHKYIVADSLIFRNNNFTGNNCDGIIMNDEKENKGYYNAEKIMITGNTFDKQNGVLLDLYRGGNDESTMGPLLHFDANKITGCNTVSATPLLKLYGVQRSFIQKNSFTDCNAGGLLIQYLDMVRALHLLQGNTFSGSGNVAQNKFVEAVGNKFR